MSEPLPQSGLIEPDLLVATCSSNGSILFRNSAWLSVFGDEDDLWSRLVDGDEKIAGQNFKEAVSGSLVTHALFMVRRIDRDAPLPVLLHFIPTRVPADGSDAVVRVVSISGEALTEPVSWTGSQTDRHRMETLGRMTMGIAHDFNNLLSGILGHVTLMNSELAGANLEIDLSEHLQTIEQAANDGAALINKIQRYIRQEKQAAFELIDLTGLIQDCMVLTRPYWYNEPRRLGIAINLEFRSTETPPILGSATELRDVFVNLLLNAVQAMPDGGQITITPLIEEDMVRIRFSDSGTGMTEAVRTRIFEPLFTTKGDQGTGMGLSVVFGVMHEHEGTIEVESKLGKGTTFTLSFPVAGSTVDPTAVIDVSGTDHVVRVLVVDDEEMVLKVVDRLLTLKGHAVRSVMSGVDAMNVLEEETYDIIITDQGMPEMSGRDLARKVRSQFSDLPIILLTGDTDLKVDKNDISRVITKPFQINDLDAAIRELT